jgi:putative hydrolase of the HAD superfamily
MVLLGDAYNMQQQAKSLVLRVLNYFRSLLSSLSRDGSIRARRWRRISESASASAARKAISGIEKFAARLAEKSSYLRASQIYLLTIIRHQLLWSSDIRSKPELILFDLGRVLADLGSPSKRMRLQIEDEDFWDLWLSLPIVQRFERGDISPDEFLSSLAVELGIHEDPLKFRRRFLDWQPRLFPSANSLISNLATECRLALLSNTNLLHWNQICNATSVFRHFERVFLSYEIRRCKPDPGAFDIVLESVAVSPADILFLDDMEQNIVAARRLGIQSVQVNGSAEVLAAISEAGFDTSGVQPQRESDYDVAAH